MTLDQRLTRAAHHVADTVTVPEVDLAAIRSTARANQRRKMALAAVAAVTVVVVGVGVAGAALSGGQRSEGPAHEPSPSVSGAWPPERIRAEGSPLDTFDYQLGSAPAGLDAQLYCTGGAACDAYDWRPITPAEERASHWALEMTQDARSVLFDVQGVPWARYFGEDSIIVEDGIGQAVRIRQLRADGTAVQLRPLSEPAPATPGRDVMLAPTLDRADNGKGTAGRGEVPYLVDERAGTLQPLDVPQEVEAWGPNVDEFLWGVNGCRVVWQQTDGAFAHHDVDCRRPGLTDLPVDYWSYLDSWAKPGRMALVEHDADGVPLVVHASVDRGATWKRIQIEDRNRDGTLAQAGPAIADALGQLD